MICQPIEGERDKLAAHALLCAQREVYVLRGRRALLAALLRDGRATADDVRAAVELPNGMNPKVFGAVPGELARAGIVAPDGFAKSRRRNAHARPVSVWRLVDRSAALAWLTAHPDRDDTPQETNADTMTTLFDLK